MIFRKCKDCKKRKYLTRHSKTWDHQPPYDLICQDCHNKKHGINPKKIKVNKKYQKGTPIQHKKGHRRGK